MPHMNLSSSFEDRLLETAGVVGVGDEAHGPEQNPPQGAVPPQIFFSEQSGTF